MNDDTAYTILERTITHVVNTTINNGGLPTRMCVIHDPETFITEVMNILETEKTTRMV